MRILIATLTFLLLAFTSTASFATSVGGDIVYSGDFENTDPSTTTRIGSGWRFFNNVFEDDVFQFFYNGLAPNGPQISALVTDQGGVDQGNVQLSIYSDYECCSPQQQPTGHFSPTGLVETNVFREIAVSSAFVGEQLTFSFDAKLGNIEGASTAMAFLRVLDPDSGFATTDEVTLESILIGSEWARYSISLAIGDWEGQRLQFGFQSRAGNFEGAGMFYDNVELSYTAVPVPGALILMVSGLLGVFARRR